MRRDRGLVPSTWLATTRVRCLATDGDRRPLGVSFGVQARDSFRRQALVAVSSISAKAYGGRMLRLNISLAPNPRLQRTRSAPLRSPLSRQPLADAKVFHGISG